MGLANGRKFLTIWVVSQEGPCSMELFCWLWYCVSGKGCDTPEKWYSCACSISHKTSRRKLKTLEKNMSQCYFSLQNHQRTTPGMNTVSCDENLEPKYLSTGIYNINWSGTGLTNRSANWCMICAWNVWKFAVFCLNNRQVLIGWWSFFKVTIRCRQCKNKNISLQHNIYWLLPTHLLINKTNEWTVI